MRAQFVVSEIWIGLRRNLTMTIAVIVTIAISLALIGAGLLIRAQVNTMKDFWFDKVEVSVFLCVDKDTTPQCKENGPATPEQKAQIRSDLKAMPQVEAVFYENQQEAWQRFQQQFRNSPLAQSAQPGDIPDSFRVKLKDPRQFEIVASAVQGRPGVESVLDEQQVLQKFFSLLNGLRNAAVFVAVVLVIAAALLIANTIRLSAYSRRRETGIMRLVGASNFYIQLPFLLEGAIAGFIGGSFAALSLVLVKKFYVERIQESFPQIAFVGWDAILQIIVVQLVVGVLLSGMASFFTLRKYLRV